MTLESLKRSRGLLHIREYGVDDIIGLEDVLAALGEDTWVSFATQWSSEPVEVETIAGGTVWSYVLGSTRYRFVPDPYDPLLDAFYTDYTSPVLSGLIVSRA